MRKIGKKIFVKILFIFFCVALMGGKAADAQINEKKIGFEVTDSTRTEAVGRDGTYAYSPTVIQEDNGEMKVYVCGGGPPGDSYRGHDAIYLTVFDKNGNKTLSSVRVVAPLISDPKSDDNLHDCAPSVIKHSFSGLAGGNEKYLMYYECAPQVLNNTTDKYQDIFAQICLAYSNDGITWQKYNEDIWKNKSRFANQGEPPTAVIKINPFMAKKYGITKETDGVYRWNGSPSLDGTSYGVGHPTAIVKDGQIWLYYYDSVGDWGSRGVFLVKSNDGFNFSSPVKISDLTSPANVEYVTGPINGKPGFFVSLGSGFSVPYFNYSWDGIHWAWSEVDLASFYTDTLANNFSTGQVASGKCVVPGGMQIAGDKFGATDSLNVNVWTNEGFMGPGDVCTATNGCTCYSKLEDPGSGGDRGNTWKTYMYKGKFKSLLADLTAFEVDVSTPTITGVARTYTAKIKNISTITSTENSFSYFFQKATGLDPDGNGVNVTNLDSSPVFQTMSKLDANEQKDATSSSVPLPAGTYYLRVCADKSSANDSGKIPEADENNNCGIWTEVVAATIPIISSTTISTIEKTTATSGGMIDSEGGSAITVRGVIWSTTAADLLNKKLDNSHTVDSTVGIGQFTTQMIELSPNTTYYVRAYATNSLGTAFGPEEVSFTTNNNVVIPPTVEISEISDSDITKNSAKGNGTIRSSGGATVTESGLVWDTSANPKIGSGTAEYKDGGWKSDGPWPIEMKDLSPNTTYFVRAYATNNGGVSYGYSPEVQFNTLPDAPIVTLTANPSTGTSPMNTALTWIVSGVAVTSCTAGDGWNGSKNSSNGMHSETITDITTATTFTLFCANSGGNSPMVSVTVPLGATPCTDPSCPSPTPSKKPTFKEN